MSQVEDDLPLANLATGAGEQSVPDQTTPSESEATPGSAPVIRQLRQTRSQSARNTPAAQGATDAKAKQAAEVSKGVDEEDVDILGLSSASSGEVDITGSPTVAMSAALHAALPLGHLQEVDVLPEPATAEQAATSKQDAAATAATDAEAAVDERKSSAAAAEEVQEQPSAPVKEINSTEAAEATASPEEDKTPSGRGREGKGRGRGGRVGRGRSKTKGKGRSKAAGSASPKAPSEDQADFANVLDSPSRNDTDPAEQSLQPDQSTEDISIGRTTDDTQQQQASQQAPESSCQLQKGKSDASQGSGPQATSKSNASKADESKACKLDESKAFKANGSKASKADDMKASKANESRAHRSEEPPAKRPRRAAAVVAGQKEKVAKVGRGKSQTGKGAQARRGVVQESESEQETSNIEIVDEEEDVDVDTIDEPPSREMDVDEKPQPQASKKRARKSEDQPSVKGRPKSGPGGSKGPAPAAVKANKGSADGSAVVGAKQGKGASAATAPAGAAAKERQPSSGRQEAAKEAAKAAATTSAGDSVQQAAETQKGLLEEAMRSVDEARQAFEEARKALAEAADQVEVSLGNIGRLSGLTLDILRDTQVGKAVGKLCKLSKLHPGVTECERISTKASEVTAHMKRAVGMSTQGSGQQPQSQPQQPKKAVPKADSRLTSPSSPSLPRPSSATAAAAVATGAAPAVPPAEQLQEKNTASGKAEYDSGPQQIAPSAQTGSAATDVKLEAFPRAHLPVQMNQGPKAGTAAAQEAPGAAPGNALAEITDQDAAFLIGPGPIPASKQQQPQAAASNLAKPSDTLPGPAGTGGLSLGDAVRDKAVAILGLALTCPSDLTPQEAAIAVEEAVFAQFAEQGVPGMRYKRRLHALWSYLRGTADGPVIPKLRQKVLQGEVLAKTLAKIDRAQAQQLCQLKSGGGIQPAQKAQAQVQQQTILQQQAPQQLPQHQVQPQQQSAQQLPQQLHQQQQAQSQQQQLQHQQPQQLHQPLQHPPQPQQLHPWQHSSSAAAAAAAAVPYSTAGTNAYDPAMYQHQHPWHNRHQQPYGVAAPGVLPGLHMPLPGAALPLSQAQAPAQDPTPPPPPAEAPLESASSGRLGTAPPPPAEDPPDALAAPQSHGPPEQSLTTSSAQAIDVTPPSSTTVQLLKASGATQPSSSSMRQAERLPAHVPGPAVRPSAPDANAQSAANIRFLSEQAAPVVKGGRGLTTGLKAVPAPQAVMQQQAGHSATNAGASVPKPLAFATVTDTASPFVDIGNEWSDSDRPPGVEVERSTSDVMDMT